MGAEGQGGRAVERAGRAQAGASGLTLWPSDSSLRPRRSLRKQPSLLPGARGGSWLVSSSDTERLLCLGCSGQGRPSLLSQQGPVDTRPSPLPLRPVASSSSPSLLPARPASAGRKAPCPALPSVLSQAEPPLSWGLGVRLSRPPPPRGDGDGGVTTSRWEPLLRAEIPGREENLGA